MTIESDSASSDAQDAETGPGDGQPNPDNGKPDPGNEQSSSSDVDPPPSPTKSQKDLGPTGPSSQERAIPSELEAKSSPDTTPPRGPATPNKASIPPNARPSPVGPPKPSQPENPTKAAPQPEGSPVKSPPDEPAQNSFNKSDIESLYASPSPEKRTAELEPIEIDSDPDFEMMEQMLLSHRGPSSQSQPIKKESTAQLQTLFGTKRPLKRQRSYPSPNSSQIPAKTPRADLKPAKRPRVNRLHSSNSVVVLNDRRKHPEFWDLDGTVILQVDDVLFRVMRSALSKASPWFQRLFSEEHGHLEIMVGCPLYTIEEDFSHLDFANLLRGLENGL